MPALITTAMLAAFSLSACVLLSLLCWSATFTPVPDDPPLSVTSLDAFLGPMLHIAAYLLAGPRLLFALPPWLVKRMLFLLLGPYASRLWHSLGFQVIRLFGEILNLWITLLLVLACFPPSHSRSGAALLGLAAAAEVIRLAAQRGQMVASALWQWLPHRRFAARLKLLELSSRGYLARYCRYYALSDAERLAYIITCLRARSAADPLARRRLRHLRDFRIVPDKHPLRSGYVRDVARGEVFVHRRWTNDPWLLIGQALRRTPWMFDPREIQRPFGYRTMANRRATAFVLSRVRYSPGYAWYQFGHEVKAAGHDLWLRALRVLGSDHEPPIAADGTFPFDRLTGQPAMRGLWSEDEVLDELRRSGAMGVSALQIAERYTFPLLYVEEVLLPRMDETTARAAPQPARKASAISAAVRAGASQ